MVKTCSLSWGTMSPLGRHKKKCVSQYLLGKAQCVLDIITVHKVSQTNKALNLLHNLYTSAMKHNRKKAGLYFNKIKFIMLWEKRSFVLTIAHGWSFQPHFSWRKSRFNISLESEIVSFLDFLQMKLSRWIIYMS